MKKRQCKDIKKRCHIRNETALIKSYDLLTALKSALTLKSCFNWLND